MVKDFRVGAHYVVVEGGYAGTVLKAIGGGRLGVTCVIVVAKNSPSVGPEVRKAPGDHFVAGYGKYYVEISEEEIPIYTMGG